MKRKKILIAGTAGFLGSHLVDYYLSQGFDVVGLDNLSTGRMENLSHLKRNSNFKFIKHDLVLSLPKSISSQKFDLILNFACPASPVHYQKLAIETLMVSSRGTKNLIDLAIKNRCRLVHASTSEIYGDPLVHPQTEEYWGNANSYGPRSMYDEGKRFAEALIWSAQTRHGLNAGIIRIFNTYGPRMTVEDGRVVSNLITQALKGRRLTIYGDGGQTRSFCFVSDLVEGISKLASSDYQEPINLGNPSEFTINELAEKVIKLTCSRSKIKHMLAQVDDPKQRQPDINLANRILNWQPKISLNEGLRQTIKYFRIEQGDNL